jgi:thiamine biosynthesis lipoprotein
VLASAVLTLCLAAPASSTVEARVVMGTVAKLEVWGLSPASAALDDAFAAIRRVDDAVSLWKDSELSRLNGAGRATPSADLMAILRASLNIAVATGGAFDPSIEPLLRAQGFYDGTPRPLSDAERRRVMARVGFRRVQLEGNTVRLQAGTALDLAGIAKGYAVDQALAALRRHRASAAVVDLGGSSVGAFGTPVEIEIRGGLGTFRLDDASLGTAGGDQRTGHIIDPRSGHPAEGVVFATVVAPTGMEADGLDTALYVLGRAGLPVLTSRGVEGFVVIPSAAGHEVHATPGFAVKRKLRLAKGVVAR